MDQSRDMIHSSHITNIVCVFGVVLCVCNNSICYMTGENPVS